MLNLSIIIPTYGRADKIERAIASSLIAPEIEVIVVDDNGQGTENQLKTKKILDEYISSGRINYYMLKTNSGASLARNYGVSKASGDYVTFLDDDDFFISDSLLDKLNYFKKCSNDYDICCSHMIVEKCGHRVISKECVFTGDDAKSFLLYGKCYTSMIMMKKKIFCAIGGFYNTPYYQDHTLMLRALNNNLSVCVYDKKTFVHTLHAGKTITKGQRPIKGAILRCELEKRLSKKTNLSKFERYQLQFRWNTVAYHSFLVNQGRTFGVFLYLIKNVLLKAFSIDDFVESVKLLVKFFANYQYYSK